MPSGTLWSTTMVFLPAFLAASRRSTGDAPRRCRAASRRKSSHERTVKSWSSIPWRRPQHLAPRRVRPRIGEAIIGGVGRQDHGHLEADRGALLVAHESGPRHRAAQPVARDRRRGVAFGGRNDLEQRGVLLGSGRIDREPLHRPRVEETARPRGVADQVEADERRLGLFGVARACAPQRVLQGEVDEVGMPLGVAPHVLGANDICEELVSARSARVVLDVRLIGEPAEQNAELADVDGRADVCGRGDAGVVCARSASRLGWIGFAAAELRVANLGDVYGWNATETCWDTVVPARVRGRPEAQWCGRGTAGIWCSARWSISRGARSARANGICRRSRP